jgi:hypothetical protein
MAGMLKPAILGIFLATGCMVGEEGNGLPTGPADEQEPEPEPEPETPTGSIQMTATTAPRNIAGGYAPANAVVVWVEDAQGNFVKTIERKAQARIGNLVAWMTAAGPGDTDSVSSASRLDHNTPLSFQWKLKDRNKQPIPDGTYTIHIEVAETNAVTAGENQQAQFTFTVGPNPENQTGLTNGGVTNVSIDYTPAPL